VDPIGPRSCYDESKRFAEALVTSARRELGIVANIVRLFNVYGPGMQLDDGRVVPEMISAAIRDLPILIHGDGHQTRSFCYIADTVSALVLVLEDADLDGAVLNIGNPEEVGILDLAQRIVRMVGGGSIVHTSARPGDPGRRRPIIERFQARYAWSPASTLDDGLALTIADLSQRIAR
jgi:nucleoside-diphosphate-sugar epimerase